MLLQERTVPIEDLLLDPNNYRFQDLPEWRRVSDVRFHETRVQHNTLELLESVSAFELAALKDSIRTNGLVPLEQIVVRVYTPDETKFVVVEGNRRVAAVKSLLEDEAGGSVTLAPEAKASLVAIRVLFLDMTLPENAAAVPVLMAIRHVSGIKEWGAYQQARLIVELLEDHGASFASVAERLGMTSREVARRFRASKALRQMETSEEYKGFALPRMYAIFHEAVAQPAVRDWLGWDDQEYICTKTQNVSDFYSLITDAPDSPAKITGYEDVRTKFKLIITVPQALQRLLEPDTALDEAYQLAIEEVRVNENASSLTVALRAARRALDDITRTQLRTLTVEHRDALRELQETIAQTLDDYDRLQRE